MGKPGNKNQSSISNIYGKIPGANDISKDRFTDPEIEGLGSVYAQTKWGEVSKTEQNPTRRDSVGLAYHNRHIANKTPEYLNDSSYDPNKKEAAKIAKKFPDLDTYMKTEEGRASVGQGTVIETPNLFNKNQK